jgi:hypothetical protein
MAAGARAAWRALESSVMTARAVKEMPDQGLAGLERKALSLIVSAHHREVIYLAMYEWPVNHLVFCTYFVSTLASLRCSRIVYLNCTCSFTTASAVSA